MFLKITVIALAFTTLSAHAGAFNCKENREFQPKSPKGEFSLTITTLRDITRNVPYGKDFDAVYEVLVNVKKTNGSRVLMDKKFKAVATSMDVMYKISAVKSHGFRFNTYLDELDQSEMTVVDTDWNQVKVHLDCN